MQSFAVALGIWCDTSGLGGQYLVASGLAAKFRFNVTAAGGGAATYNVGSNGASFGVANNTSLTVLAILNYMDNQFTPSTGVFYGGEQTKTSGANNVVNGINTTGDLTLSGFLTGFRASF